MNSSVRRVSSVGREHQALQLRRGVARSIQAPDDRTETGSRDEIDRDAVPFQGFQNADLCNAARTATAQHQCDAGTLLCTIFEEPGMPFSGILKLGSDRESLPAAGGNRRQCPEEGHQEGKNSEETCHSDRVGKS
jgi:hypothetical protein